jgi:hypothetical protein
MYRANKLIKKSNKIILKYKDYSNLKKLLLEKKHGRIVAYQTLFADRFPGCANWTQKDEFDLCILKDHIKQFTKSDILSAEEYTTKLFCLGFGISNEIYDRETKKLNYQKRFYELDLCDRNKVCDSILENIDVYKKERNENQIELAHIIYNYYMKKFNIVNVNSNCTKRKNKFSNFK